MSDTPNDMPTRVAVLEQITKETRDALTDLRTEVRQGFTDMRSEMRQGFADMRAETRAIRSEARTDYRWLLSLMLGMSGALLAVMAHGFHWL